jgi:hypothetical protein
VIKSSASSDFSSSVVRSETSIETHKEAPVKSTYLLVVASVLSAGLLSGSSIAKKKRADQCFVDVQTNLFGNPAVPCDYRFTMLVNPDGTIVSSGGGTRACAGNPLFPLGAGNGTVGTPSTILFPNVADIRFDLPAQRDEGAWVTGLVQSLSDRGGSSPVTASQMICADAP